MRVEEGVHPWEAVVGVLHPHPAEALLDPEGEEPAWQSEAHLLGEPDPPWALEWQKTAWRWDPWMHPAHPHPCEAEPSQAFQSLLDDALRPS